MRAIARWGTASALLTLAACTPPQPSATQVLAPAAAPTPALSAQDQQFVRMAGASDLFEIQSSELALRRTGDAAAHRFASQMIRDHRETTRQLNAIVSAKGLTPVLALDASQQQMMDQLGGMRGAKFAGEYRNDQVQGHQQAVQAFQTEADNGYDADIKRFAQQSLPLLRQHLTMAQRLK